MTIEKGNAKFSATDWEEGKRKIEFKIICNRSLAHLIEQGIDLYMHIYEREELRTHG